ncbi:hypothetical protein GJ744_009155 [Endocarpon pusillum]|uniref:Uncharacterized protein n=1 Tax=Endocarpon pusillum TaxID=364733 RepID=A0A8H7AK64_9EURO|nr:hypothetical protein GJ744_009155 [Endocarpon pusillum]
MSTPSTKYQLRRTIPARFRSDKRYSIQSSELREAQLIPDQHVANTSKLRVNVTIGTEKS